MKMFIVFLILIILNCRPENKTANLWPLLLVGSQSNVRQNTSTTTGTGSGTSTTTGTGSGTSTTPGGTSNGSTVVGTSPLSSAKDITAFAIQVPATSGVIIDSNISITLPYNTNLSSLIATFTTTGKSVKIGGVTQVSGSTVNNFTSNKIYTIYAEDSSAKNYNVFASSGSCTDLVRNGPETDTDCGGGICSGCATQKKCLVNSDCSSNICFSKNSIQQCVNTVSCTNGVKDGLETDVDCGGASCLQCAVGNSCSANSDCNSLNCVGSVCQPAQL
jgi:hypothetical protein